MAKAKTFVAKAYTTDGELIYSNEVQGRKNERPNKIEALRALMDKGGYMLEQTKGAASWAVWRVEKGANQADSVLGEERIAIINKYLSERINHAKSNQTKSR